MTASAPSLQMKTHGPRRPDLARVFATCVLLLAGLLLPVAAQQITGSIVGTVKDEQGALIPSAKVQAANVDTGFSRSAATDTTTMPRSSREQVDRAAP